WVFVVSVASCLREAPLRTEKIPRHPLDSRDVDKRVAGLGRSQILVRQDLGIEWVIVAEVFPLEFLAVNLVFVGELVALRRVERIELADGLRRQRLAVHEKQDATGEPAFEQPVNLRYGEKGFSRAGRHRDEECPPSR